MFSCLCASVSLCVCVFKSVAICEHGRVTPFSSQSPLAFVCIRSQWSVLTSTVYKYTKLSQPPFLENEVYKVGICIKDVIIIFKTSFHSTAAVITLTFFKKCRSIFFFASGVYPLRISELMWILFYWYINCKLLQALTWKDLFHFYSILWLRWYFELLRLFSWETVKATRSYEGMAKIGGSCGCFHSQKFCCKLETPLRGLWASPGDQWVPLPGPAPLLTRTFITDWTCPRVF